MAFHVYILANESMVLYVGVTSDLRRRIYEHKNHLVGGFTQRYNIDRLVYAESFGEPIAAIEREKQLKLLNRRKKIALIERDNPSWRDLSEEF